MDHPSHPPPNYQEPSSSPQGSDSTEQSTSTTSIHTSDSFPLLIQHQIYPLNSPPTVGHAFIHLPTSPPPTLSLLTNTAIQALRETQNPNNRKLIPGTASVECLIVHWGVRPPQLGSTGMAFPRTTQLYGENFQTVLGYMRRSRGYDFVEVRFEESRLDLAERRGNVLLEFPLRPRGAADKGKGKERGGKGAGKGFGGAPLNLDYTS